MKQAKRAKVQASDGIPHIDVSKVGTWLGSGLYQLREVDEYADYFDSVTDTQIDIIYQRVSDGSIIATTGELAGNPFGTDKTVILWMR